MYKVKTAHKIRDKEKRFKGAIKGQKGTLKTLKGRLLIVLHLANRSRESSSCFLHSRYDISLSLLLCQCACLIIFLI